MQWTKTSFLPLLLLGFCGNAQSTSGAKATVNVVVTGTDHHPRKDEEVLFVSQKMGDQVSAKTNAQGKASVALATGDTYTIKLKTLNDTSSKSAIEIPALEPGQYFESPFTVDIEYEPSRTYTLNNVHFDTGKPTLRSNSYRELNDIVAYLKIKEGQRIEVGGHTDNKGKPEDNARLSQARANSVKAYLVQKGIHPSRIVAKGYGDTKPVADNETEEGRQKNRRTEVTLL